MKLRAILYIGRRVAACALVALAAYGLISGAYALAWQYHFIEGGVVRVNRLTGKAEWLLYSQRVGWQSLMPKRDANGFEIVRPGELTDEQVGLKH